jgi:hypothetical protein
MPFRVTEPSGIALSVRRSHFVVWTTLWSSRWTERPGGLVRGHLLSEASALLRSLSHPSLGPGPQVRDPSPEVSSPTARQGSKVRLTRACLPATFRPQGLTSLSAVFSLRTPARHVADGRRSWGSPFGGFLSREVTRPLDRIGPTRRLRLGRLRSKPRSLPRRPTSGL